LTTATSTERSGEAIKAILCRARERYFADRVQDRPARQPWNYVGLFEAEDLVELAKAKLWPLPPRLLRFVTTAPEARAEAKEAHTDTLLLRLLERLAERPDAMQALARLLDAVEGGAA